MISVEQLLYKIDLRLNKLASTDHQNIPDENKILALNEAQIKLIKKKIDKNNVYGVGFDGFRKRYEDLQHLVMPHEPLPATKTSSPIDSYQAPLSALSERFMFPVDVFTICSKDTCIDRTVWIETIAKHSDITVLLANNFYKPSFEYQLTFAAITSDDMIVYTDDLFDVSQIYISYLRYPVEMDIAGYVHFDGAASATIDCELANYLEDELLDIATQDLAFSTENIAASQASQTRLQNNE